MATDSNQIENAHSIYESSACSCCQRVVADLSHIVLVWEQHSEHQASAQEILYFEGIDARVMGGLIIVEHEIDGIGRRSEEHQLEGGVPCRVGKSPEDIFAELASPLAGRNAYPSISSHTPSGIELAI